MTSGMEGEEVASHLAELHGDVLVKLCESFGVTNIATSNPDSSSCIHHGSTCNYSRRMRAKTARQSGATVVCQTPSFLEYQ